jgi:hypothetical protein
MRTIETILGGIKRRHPGANVGLVDVPAAGRRVEYKEYADSGRRPDIHIYATTEDVDMEDDVIVASGGDVKRYMGVNRNLFVDHDYGISAAVGYARVLTLDHRGWRVTAQLNDNDNEYQRAVVALAKAGTLAMSVGADFRVYGPPDAEEKAKWPGAKRVIREWTMLEGSFTAMPMNPAARQIGEWRDKSINAIKSAGVPDRVLDVFRLPRRVTTVVVV